MTWGLQVTGTELLELAKRIAKRIYLRPSYYSREDIEQDAAVILLGQKYDPSCGVAELPWRWRRCIRDLRDYLKHKARFTGDLPSSLHEPLIAQDEKADVRDALDSVGLSPREQAILLARYEEGLTQEEIAERFGVIQQSIQRTLANATEKLRSYFGPDYLRPSRLQPAQAGRVRKQPARKRTPSPKARRARRGAGVGG